jgi:CheY-like chemotaxis protein
VSWTVVVLALGVLVLAFATYFTHTILRHAGGAMEATVDRTGFRFKVSAQERNLAMADARAASVQRNLPADDETVAASLREGEELQAVRALWVDDNPANNVHERRMLERLHVDFDLALSTEEALANLVGRSYQLIITDLTRLDPSGNRDPNAGTEFLRLLAKAPRVPPVLVYAGEEDERADDARHFGALAVTVTPSALLEAVLDVLRR